MTCPLIYYYFKLGIPESSVSCSLSGDIDALVREARRELGHEVSVFFIYRYYILCESGSQFDSPPLTIYLTDSRRAPATRSVQARLPQVPVPVLVLVPVSVSVTVSVTVPPMELPESPPPP